MTKKDVEKLVALRLEGLTWREISLTEEFETYSANALRKTFYREVRDKKSVDANLPSQLKFLTIDIETAPILAYTWGTWDQNIPLEMIVEDWSILSYSAKWKHSDKVIYSDTSKEALFRNDYKLVKELWNLLNEANVVLSQNGVRFDIPKINSRFKHYGLPPVTSFQHVDALKINRKNFADTSNKLEFQTHKFCKLYKKSGHKKYPGNKLWLECMKGNKEAWGEMRDYNQIDVLSLEELYFNVLRPWDSSVQFNVFTGNDEYRCSCGSTDFRKNGYHYSNSGKFQRWTCNSCGKHHRDAENLLSKEKRKNLKK